MRKRNIRRMVSRRIVLDNIPEYGGEVVRHVLEVLNKYEAVVDNVTYCFIKDKKDVIKMSLAISCDSTVWSDIEDEIDYVTYTKFYYLEGITTEKL